MAICPVRVGARGEERVGAGAAAKDTITGHSGLETRSLPWRWVAPWVWGTQLGEGEKRRLGAPPFRIADCRLPGRRDEVCSAALSGRRHCRRVVPSLHLFVLDSSIEPSHVGLVARA